MSLSLSNIKRWYLMVSGKSIWHVNQGRGTCYSNKAIRGYYNDLTEKVTKIPNFLENDNLPCLEVGGKEVLFPVTIFQYGLGAYDLYLQSSDIRYERKFLQCVSWAINNQDDLGRWNAFSHYKPDAPYGAMAQGEGASLLIRAFIHTKDASFLVAAKKAIDFMLVPLEKGGTTKYDGSNAFLMEYTFKGMVLNGAIFSWWGLFDLVLATGDNNRYKIAADQALKGIVSSLPRFNAPHWSLYSLDGLISSPFYHRLHISQMQVMYELTSIDIFREYADRWDRQYNNPLNKSVAFLEKSFQKIFEK